MNDRRKTTHGLGALALALLVAVPAAPLLATPLERSVIGSGGEVFRVLSGDYGDLFPAGFEADPASAVLALEVDLSDGTSARLLVPGTEGAEVDRSPAVVYDDLSQSVHLVWQTQIGSIHPVLRLVSYGSGQWSEIIEITGNPFAAKSDPVLFVTHDSVRGEQDSAASPAQERRTFLHLVWAQESPDGSFETLYSPLLLGSPDVASSPVISLDELVGAEPGGAVVTGASGLQHIREGDDGRTVVVAFRSAQSGRIAAVELEVMPQELIRLGDAARAHIIDAGFEGGASDLRRVADVARAHIIDAGVRLGFHPEVVRSIADAARAHIIDAGFDGAGEARRIADQARAHIIDAGAKFSDHGLKRAGAVSGHRLVEIPAFGSSASENVIRIGVVNSVAPPLEIGAEPRLFVSASGTDLILAWRDGAAIVYVESRDGGEWGEARTIRLSGALSVDEAYAALARRVSSF